MKDWESPLLEQDNEWSSSFEKVNFLLFFFFLNLPFVGVMVHGDPGTRRRGF